MSPSVIYQHMILVPAVMLSHLISYFSIRVCLVILWIHGCLGLGSINSLSGNPKKFYFFSSISYQYHELNIYF